MEEINKNQEKYNKEINNIINKFTRAIDKLENETKMRTNGIYCNRLKENSWNISLFTRENNLK